MLDSFIKRKINSLLKNNRRLHTFHSLSNAKTILILFNYKDWNEVSIVEKELKSHGKTVLLWTCQADVSPNTLPATRDVRVILLKEVSKLTGIASSVIRDFKYLKYDTLLDLTTSLDNTLLYLLSINKAEFCIGCRDYKHKTFDLQILTNADKGLLETYEQIKFYWNKIR